MEKKVQQVFTRNFFQKEFKYNNITELVSSLAEKYDLDRVILDRSLGTVFGACIGDAVGSILEKLGRIPTPEEVDLAMELSGGGGMSLAPGQVTDDSEMAISMARGMSILEKN